MTYCSWSGQGVFSGSASAFACKHAMSGLILSCMATTNMGLLTSSVCVQGWTKELFSTAKTATKDDSHVLSSWKLLSDHWGMNAAWGCMFSWYQRGWRVEIEAKSSLINLSGSLWNRPCWTMNILLCDCWLTNLVRSSFSQRVLDLMIKYVDRFTPFLCFLVSLNSKLCIFLPCLKQAFFSAPYFCQ